ncbi:MAG: hypothetical protein QM706_08935 [Nitrospira sp.]
MANPSELEAAEEFFELFKTPWEPAIPDRTYDVILSTAGFSLNYNAQVFLIYASAEQDIDREAGIARDELTGPVNVQWRESTFPLYGAVSVLVSESQRGVLEAGGKSLDYLYRSGRLVIRRIGYDLFEEIRFLLTVGQPAEHAQTPSLELHVDLLKHFLCDSNIPFVEIPPYPQGYDYICCLTHDVDFFGIRRHKLDRTIAGFLYRASLGTLIDLLRGRRSLAEAAKNWLACCSLPLVFVGLVPDLWRPFDDYDKVEDMRRSTFFLVPFKGKPGVAPDGTVNPLRATPYGIGEVREEVKAVSRRGSELGVHGIDAWRDSDAGREEMEDLNSLTGKKQPGIRMHWLYFDADSPRLLEAAGYAYDSTWGYNETVGYRAGTSQVFRPLGRTILMELPLSIMDSALFSTGRMGLSREEASNLSRKIIANARRFGGTLVVNWHERSLSSERLWGRAYNDLLSDIATGERVWFAPAGEAVEWFRWRRSIQFTTTISSDGKTYMQLVAPFSAMPGAVASIYHAGTSTIDREVRLFNGGKPQEFEV